jgi:hypothetical protein
MVLASAGCHATQSTAQCGMHVMHCADSPAFVSHIRTVPSCTHQPRGHLALDSTAGAAARATVDSWRCCALRGMLRSEWLQRGKRSFTIRSRCVASSVQIVRQVHMQHSSYNVQAHRCEL